MYELKRAEVLQNLSEFKFRNEDCETLKTGLRKTAKRLILIKYIVVNIVVKHLQEKII